MRHKPRYKISYQHEEKFPKKTTEQRQKKALEWEIRYIVSLTAWKLVEVLSFLFTLETVE